MYKYFLGIDIDSDCETLLEHVKNMKLHRANNRKDLNGGKAPFSCVYGNVKWARYSNGRPRPEDPENPGKYISKLKEEYPFFEEIIREFTSIYNPNQEYSHVVINKNFECNPHMDASNVGVSSIIGLGKYGGGLLSIEKDGQEITKDIYHSFFSFDGSKYLHWVSPFTGERYSLVFYNY